MDGLATLLEGAGYLFSQAKISKSIKSFLWSFKCEKLVNKLTKVINGVPTTYLWKKMKKKDLFCIAGPL